MDEIIRVCPGPRFFLPTFHLPAFLFPAFLFPETSGISADTVIVSTFESPTYPSHGETRLLPIHSRDPRWRQERAHGTQ